MRRVNVTPTIGPPASHCFLARRFLKASEMYFQHTRLMTVDEAPLSEGKALPPPEHPMWKGGRDTVFLGAVVPRGESRPVDVVLDGREGQTVYVRRRRDPGDPPAERIPVHPGDRVVLMQALSYAGLAMTDEVGRKDDLLTLMRIVPVRRKRRHVYGRVLRYREKDDGRRVHLRPGDIFTLSGKKLVQLDVIDSYFRPDELGYAPLTDTVWTWFHIVRATGTPGGRYVLSAARRLDTAHRRLRRIIELRRELQAASASTPGPHVRAHAFELIGEVEALVVTLNRAVDMVVVAPGRLRTSLSVPGPVASRREALVEIRNAFEHIDERALGEVRGRPDPAALSVFDQEALLERQTIRYASHQLTLPRDIPMLLRHSRQFIKRLAAQLPGVTPGT